MRSIAFQDLLSLQVILPLIFTLFFWIILDGGNRELNRYHGPLLARYTKLWHRLSVKSNKHEQDLIALHRKYGEVVRIGPKSLSIANPEYISKIYGVKNEFRKSDMYDPFAPRINGKVSQSWLSTRDPNEVTRIKKPIAYAYKLSSITEYEPLVDDTVNKMLHRLEDVSQSDSSGTLDMALWMRLYALDVIMNITLSQNLCFLDTGADVNDFIAIADKNLDSAALLITMPWTAYLFKHNPIVGFFSKTYIIFLIWAQEQMQRRISNRGNHESEPTSVNTGTRDFLDHFLDASTVPDPPGYNLPLVTQWMHVNVMAGADTVAISLKAILYYLHKNPPKKEKLLQELTSAHLKTPVSWKESQHLPYLDACIKEGLRLHPPIGFGLEREVPESGLQMSDGYTLPRGTRVGMNAWVVGRQDVFGADVDSFVPERWLQYDGEDEQAHQERVARMKRADLVFGAGSRSCTGRYIAFLEIYKVIPTLLLEFDVFLADEQHEWTTINRWIVRQEDIPCRLRRKAS